MFLNNLIRSSEVWTYHIEICPCEEFNKNAVIMLYKYVTQLHVLFKSTLLNRCNQQCKVRSKQSSSVNKRLDYLVIARNQ